MRNIKLGLCLALLLGLTGCKSTALYDWGEYDENLYEYYHDPIAAKEFPAVLEKHLEQLESKNLRPAPGLYAEVGTFKLKSGDTKEAIAFYKKEASTWPESAPLMDALVKNLERQSDK
ncbi:DUF4810 domain-containing protein [Vibrio sp. Of14-4]|uniref:DUF4810 domain-containing protein n=1 Tax=Vibrio tetraodonis subsp. pristinus TaxID=2695891 RepID=A0A6L8LYK7_9VIBR|nr:MULTISPECIES: DUF4810 domain-containing protein [Vibrio]MCG7489088.1 DUF4810 domain-containing protein [Vibrio sp. Of14-4]MYM60563.1 DUF4810 domain-containing protein [Vibrio tetraodonis subsp. pristinus]